MAAARVLAKYGYERANVNTIAEVAGVGIGSVYQYFPTKEALVAEVMRRHTGDMIDAFGRDLGEIGLLPLPLATRAVVARALAAHAIAPDLVRVLVQEVPRTGDLTRPTEFEDQLTFLLRAYMTFQREALRPVDIDIAARIVVTAVEAVAVDFALRDPKMLTSDALVDELTALVLRYIARDT